MEAILTTMMKNNESNQLQRDVRRAALLDTLKALEENPDLVERLRLLLRPKP